MKKNVSKPYHVQNGFLHKNQSAVNEVM